MARDEAMLRSELMMISHPPPKQRPLMAQMMGFLPLRRDRPPKPDGGVVSLLLVVVLRFHSDNHNNS